MKPIPTQQVTNYMGRLGLNVPNSIPQAMQNYNDQLRRGQATNIQITHVPRELNTPAAAEAWFGALEQMYRQQNSHSMADIFAQAQTTNREQYADWFSQHGGGF